MFTLKGLGRRTSIESQTLSVSVPGYNDKTTVSLSKTKRGLNFYGEQGEHLAYIRFSKGVSQKLQEKSLTIEQLLKASKVQPLISKPYEFESKDAQGNVVKGEVASFMTPEELRAQGINVEAAIAGATPLVRTNASATLVF